MLEITKAPAPPRPKLCPHLAHHVRHKRSGGIYLCSRIPGKREGEQASVLFFDGSEFTYGTDLYYNDEFEYVASKPWADIKVVF